MVSVIVPIYNRENYIERCIRSVLEQTYRDIEIVLVNDGSTDNSLILMTEFATLDNRIKIINKQNGGISSAVALGIKNAIGDYVTFVDSDDYVGNELIQNYLDNIEGYDVVCMGYYEDNGEIISKNIKPGIWEGNELELLMSDSSPIMSVRWNKLIKREVLKKFLKVYQSLNISNGEDLYFSYLLNYSLYVGGGKIKSIDQSNLYYHYINFDSITLKKFDNKLYLQEVDNLLKADELICDYTRVKCSLAYELIYVLSGIYIKNSKYYHKISRKDSVKVIKAILNNKSYQKAVSIRKSTSKKNRVRKIAVKLKLAKVIYIFT